MARKSPAQGAVARQIEFSPIGRTRVQVTFDEPELSSDGGALLLREAARINGIIPSLATAPRRERGRPVLRRSAGHGPQPPHRSDCASGS